MTRSLHRCLTIVVAGALAAAGAVLSTAGAASATPTTTVPTPTCNDPITGVSFLASWTGTAGDDVIWAQPGAVLVAGAGNDVVITDLVGTKVIACLGDGADWFSGSDPQSFPQGTAFSARGEAGPDNLRGGTGNDYLVGGNDNDVLIGGPGVDTVDGGPGVDQCDAEVEINCEF